MLAGMTNDEILDDAELFLARTSLRLIGPLPGECLVCYLARMLGEWGCRGPRFIDHYRDTVAPRATALRERLSRMGACCCDCEVFLNVYELRREPPPIGGIERILMNFDEDLDPDEFGDEFGDEPTSSGGERPPCQGVRRGSTQPCANWQRQYRARYW